MRWPLPFGLKSRNVIAIVSSDSLTEVSPTLCKNLDGISAEDNVSRLERMKLVCSGETSIQGIGGHY